MLRCLARAGGLGPSDSTAAAAGMVSTMAAIKIGPAIRTRLGPWETPVADAYRSFFLNLDDCATLISSMWPARRILEVGCGDGSFGERLLAHYPNSDYVGIDVAGEPGRLFRGPRSRATFRAISSAQLLQESPEPFDLVLLVDVLHHVPIIDRSELLGDLRRLTRDGGHYAVKEWEPTRTSAHYLAWFADRFITGDRVAHVTPPALKNQLNQLLGDQLVVEARVHPRRNNYLLGYEKASS